MKTAVLAVAVLCLLAAASAEKTGCICGGLPACSGGCHMVDFFGNLGPCGRCPNACGDDYCEANEMCVAKKKGEECVKASCSNLYVYRCGGSPSTKLDTSCATKDMDCATGPNFSCKLGGGNFALAC